MIYLKLAAARRRRSLWLGMGLVVWLASCAGPVEPTPTATPTPDPVVAQGKQVFQQQCAICHATAPETIIRGPSLAGVAVRAAARVPGLDARNYLYTSILNPSAYVVEGFEDLMPADLGKQLTGAELDAVVAYLLTFDP